MRSRKTRSFSRIPDFSASIHEWILDLYRSIFYFKIKVRILIDAARFEIYFITLRNSLEGVACVLVGGL